MTVRLTVSCPREIDDEEPCPGVWEWDLDGPNLALMGRSCRHITNAVQYWLAYEQADIKRDGVRT